MSSSFKIIVPTVAIALFFVATNVLFAAPVNPPDGNVPPPINEGTGDQTKRGGVLTMKGTFMTDILGVFGNSLFNMRIKISNRVPSVFFEESDNSNKSWRLSVNNGEMRFMSGLPQLWVRKLTFTDTYAKFSGQIRAARYCNKNGTKCLNPSVGLPACADGQILVSKNAEWLCGKPSSAPAPSLSKVIQFNRTDLYLAVQSIVTNPSEYRGEWSVGTFSLSRDEVCNLMGNQVGTGGSFVSYTVSRYSSPANNGIAVFDGASWTVGPATPNSFINTINCAITGIADKTFEWVTDTWGGCYNVTPSCSGFTTGLISQKDRNVRCEIVGTNTSVTESYCDVFIKPPATEICSSTYVCEPR